LVEVNPQNAAIPELRKKLDKLKGSTTAEPTKK